MMETKMASAPISKAVPPSSQTLSRPRTRVSIQLPIRRPNQQLCKSPILVQPIKPIKDTHNSTAPRSVKKSTSSDVLRLMDSLGLPIPEEIYASLIKECTLSCDSARALELHSHINRSFFRLTLPLTNRLLLLHVACGHLEIARQLFDEMNVKKDLNSWAIIVVAYLGDSRFEEGTRLFVEMLRHVNPSLGFPSWVLVCILNACACTSNLGIGKQVHGLSLKLGFSNDPCLNSSLINFYGKLGYLEVADFVFDEIPQRNVAIWTAKMVNNCREERFSEVLEDYKEMAREGVRWNSFSLSSALRACARTGRTGGICGRQIHVNAIKLGLESDDFVQCGLIDMYGKRGMIWDAKRVFEMITDKNNAAYWNAMLKGYLQNGLNLEAMKFMYCMEAAGIELQESTINEVRISCGTANYEENRTEPSFV